MTEPHSNNSETDLLKRIRRLEARTYQGSTPRDLTSSVAPIDGWDLSDDGTLEGPEIQTTDARRLKVDARNAGRNVHRGELVDNFEDLSNWSGFYAGNSVEAETDDNHLGSQSLQINSDGEKCYASDDTVALDLTGKYPAVPVKVEGTGDVGGWAMIVELLAWDSSGNRIRFDGSVKVHSGEPTGWHWVDLGYAERLEDAVDLTDIVEIRLGAWQDVTLKFDNLMLMEGPQPAKVLLATDDGRNEDLTQSAPILSEYGWSATTYVNVGEVGNDGRMDWGDLEEIRDRYNWSVASHGHPTHEQMPDLTVEEQEEAIQRSKSELMAHGHHEGAHHVAWPYNDFEIATLDLANQHHLTARQSSDQPAGVANPLNIGSESADDGLTTALQDKLQHAANHGGIMCVFWHGGNPTETQLRNVLDEIQTHVQNGDMEVVRSPLELVDPA